MAAMLSLSLPFPTTIPHSIPSLHRPFVMSIVPFPLFHRKGLYFRLPARFSAHLPRRSFRMNRLRTWAAEEEEVNPVEETPGDGGEGGEGSAEQPMVLVPVSASDTFDDVLPEGIMSDSAVGIVTKALEWTEGITDLKVQIIEVISSVELTKQTTIQATV